MMGENQEQTAADEAASEVQDTPRKDLPPAAQRALAEAEERRRKARIREKLKPLTNRVNKLTKEMETLEARRAEVQQILTDPGLYESDRADELQKLLAENGELTTKLEALEREWMAAEEELEALKAEA